MGYETYGIRWEEINVCVIKLVKQTKEIDNCFWKN